MTLIEQRSGDGRLTGRCDARCYNARTPRCECVCGGKNHGVGLHMAIENMADLLEENPELKPNRKIENMIGQLALPLSR